MLLPAEFLVAILSAVFLLLIGGAGMMVFGLYGTFTSIDHRRSLIDPIWWGAALLLLALALVLLLLPLLR